MSLYQPLGITAIDEEKPRLAVDRPLRIALLGYRSHPHVGGQGIYLAYLSKALVELGHQVDVISGPPYPELDARVKLISLPSLDLYAHPQPTRALRWRHLLSWADFYEWWSKLSGAFGEPYCFGRRVKHYFKKYRPQYDVVHDNQTLSYGVLGLQTQGVSLVTTIHHPITRDRELALAATKTKGEHWLVNRWYSFLDMQTQVAQQLDNIHTVSQQSKRDICEAFACAEQRINVIPNGVDTEVFRPVPAIPVEPLRIITTASSDQPLKGLSVLLKAIAHVRTNFPQLHLRVIGSLKPEGVTAAELDQLGLVNSVSFVSGISTQELVEEYARAQIAVVPSLYEGFGLPAAEALACGKPLVCSDGGALPEVVGDAAILVKAGDDIALAQALQQLLESESLLNQLTDKARAHSLQHLSWSVVAEQMVDYYRSRIC